MRIIHVIDTLDASRGGPPAVAVRMAAAQLAMGHQVSVLTTVRPGDDLLEGKSYQHIVNIKDLKADALPSHDLRLIFATSYRKEVKKYIEKADVLHMHGVWDPLLLTAGEIARAEGIPYVIRPCGMLDPWSLSQHPVRKRLGIRFIYKKLWNGAAFLHLLNKDEAELIKPLELTAPQVVIPNGVYESEVSPLPQKGTFRQKFPQIQDRPFILFLSRLHYKKGLDILAEAFEIISSELPNVDLVIAGPDEGAGAGFAEMIETSNLQSRVHIVGPLYGSDKLAAMVDAELFCLPSRQEGFSVAILEAMACGLPVVVTEQCHFPEIGERGAGSVVPLDPVKIAESLHFHLSNPEQSRAMGEKARKMALGEYTWPNVAFSTVRSYGRYCQGLVKLG